MKILINSKIKKIIIAFFLLFIILEIFKVVYINFYYHSFVERNVESFIFEKRLKNLIGKEYFNTNFEYVERDVSEWVLHGHYPLYSVMNKYNFLPFSSKNNFTNSSRYSLKELDIELVHGFEYSLKSIPVCVFDIQNGKDRCKTNITYADAINLANDLAGADMSQFRSLYYLDNWVEFVKYEGKNCWKISVPKEVNHKNCTQEVAFRYVDVNTGVMTDAEYYSRQFYYGGGNCTMPE